MEGVIPQAGNGAKKTLRLGQYQVNRNTGKQPVICRSSFLHHSNKKQGGILRFTFYNFCVNVK